MKRTGNLAAQNFLKHWDKMVFRLKEKGVVIKSNIVHVETFVPILNLINDGERTANVVGRAENVRSTVSAPVWAAV
jgi:hypothetical protein